jgi:hypothetical protein
MLNLAVERARRDTGQSIRNYDFAVAGRGRDESALDMVLTLSDHALKKKTSAAASYSSLQTEVRETIDREGIDAIRTERLREVAKDAFQPDPSGVPFYELHGREQVRAGRYRETLTYRTHYRPFVEALRASLNSERAMSSTLQAIV